tara:strand:- start:200 stop:442 length:243 start_codon:yes stop_codon:yes gene_type:complete
MNWNYDKLIETLNKKKGENKNKDQNRCANIFIEHMENKYRIYWAEDVIHDTDIITVKYSFYELLDEWGIDHYEHMIPTLE